MRSDGQEVLEGARVSGKKGGCGDRGRSLCRHGCPGQAGGLHLGSGWGGLQAGQWSPGGSGLSRHKAELEPRVGELGGVSLGRVAGPGGG